MTRAAELKSQFASLLVPKDEPKERGRFSTGVGSIDDLSGGVPRAAFTEIAGSASSGRTALLLSIVRGAMADGEFCALVDTQNSFDPESAASVGLHMSQLLWIRCGGSAEYALKAADLLLSSGGFAIVAVDLGDLPEAVLRKIPFSVWHRLKLQAEQRGAALVTTGPRIHAGSCSQLQLELQQHELTWSDKLFRGVVVVAGTRRRNQLRKAQFELLR